MPLPTVFGVSQEKEELNFVEESEVDSSVVNSVVIDDSHTWLSSQPKVPN